MDNFIHDLEQLFKVLKLKVCLTHYAAVTEQFEKEKRSFLELLHELLLREAESRQQTRINNLIKMAKLARNKLLSDFDITRYPGLAASQIQQLASGDFIEGCGNVLIFGNPGTGKSHLSIALTREWCLLGRRCRFFTAAELVQHLLEAKAKLQLTAFIKKLDKFDVLIIDDISYVPFERHETDVLFTLFAARYEMRSLVITSNLPFSKWNKIFKDEMTTNAAIDRLIHHAVILELNAPSYRMEQAKSAEAKTKKVTSKSKKKQEVTTS